jgi:dihydroorotase
MRSGDIITHTFEKVHERLPIVDEEGKIRPFVVDARRRGILFDVGHGGAGFWFSQAMPAAQQNFWPDTFGTDLHRFSMNAGMKDMLNVMSKFLNLGMPLDQVIGNATWGAAKAIRRSDLGKLAAGSPADIAVLRLRQGDFGFVDAAGARLAGSRKLEAEMTINGGKIVWDLNGLSALGIDK